LILRVYFFILILRIYVVQKKSRYTNVAKLIKLFVLSFEVKYVCFYRIIGDSAMQQF
jgi:hypothetical protein